MRAVTRARRLRGPATLRLFVLLWLAACSRPERARHEPAPLALEVGGCARITQGRCELPNGGGKLTLFARGAGVSVLAETRTVPLADVRSMQQGTRFSLEVPAGTRALTVHARGARARLELAPDSFPRELYELYELRRAGALDELALRLAQQDSVPHERCFAARLESVRARLAFSRSQVDDVISHYRRSIPALFACGHVSEAAADGFALFYALSEQQNDVSAARRVLAELEPQLGSDHDARAWLLHYRAGAALRLGQWGDALALLNQARQAGERIGRGALVSASLQTRGWVESLLGRHDLAAESTASALATLSQADACARATALTNAGYQGLLAAEAGKDTLASARGRLLEALAASERGCAHEPLRARILVNLAQASVLAGELARAIDEAARARAVGDGADLMLHTTLLDVRGRALLGAGDARRALALYDELVLRLGAAGASLPQGELGRARALTALGRLEGASAALTRAEDELQRQLREVPLSLGRESFALGRQEVATRLISSLLALGRGDAAMDAALRARARVLAPVAIAPGARAAPERDARARYEALREQLEQDARRAWQLPNDQLAAAAHRQRERRAELARLLDRAFPPQDHALARRELAPGELLLALVVLAEPPEIAILLRDGAGTSFERVAVSQVAASLERMLPRLVAAERVSVLAPSEGPLERPHTLVVAGAPLFSHVPIAYTVGLPAQAAAPRARGRTLFVIDPRGDLPGAMREGRWLRGQLGRALDVDWLEGRAATRSRLRTSMPLAHALHFAGHTSLSPESFWNSGLALAQGSLLTVADILALPAVPGEVVLSACESAASAPAGAAVGLGIAQAFLARGADSVIATTEPVDDAVAAAFARAFYADSAWQSETHPAERLRRALETLRGQGLPWSSYRLLVP